MEKDQLTILLPGRLSDCFAMIFESLGYKVLWDADERNLESMIRDNEFDVAFEWQYGHEDHTVLDLVKKYHKKAVVILCLNWNGKLPADYEQSGYFAYMDTPFTAKDLNLLFDRILQIKNSHNQKKDSI